MQNKAMERKIEKKECIDVALHGIRIDHEVYELSPSLDIENIDLCIGATEQWIFSVGKRKADGRVFAAVDARFYPSDEIYECIWLR